MDVKKQDFEFWHRLVIELKQTVQIKADELAVNSFFLENAKLQLAKFPKPQPKKNEIAG